MVYKKEREKDKEKEVSPAIELKNFFSVEKLGDGSLKLELSSNAEKISDLIAHARIIKRDLLSDDKKTNNESKGYLG